MSDTRSENDGRVSNIVSLLDTSTAIIERRRKQQEVRESERVAAGFAQAVREDRRVAIELMVSTMRTEGFEVLADFFSQDKSKSDPIPLANAAIQLVIYLQMYAGRAQAELRALRRKMENAEVLRKLDDEQ